MWINIIFVEVSEECTRICIVFTDLETLVDRGDYILLMFQKFEALNYSF